MNHNQAPSSPMQQPHEQLGAPERLIPVTGAEFVAYLETRIPTEQRARLHTVGERFDATMGALGQPPSTEVAQQVGTRYESDRAKAFDKLGSPYNHMMRASEYGRFRDPEHDVDLETDRKRDKLFPLADPEALGAGIAAHFDIRPKVLKLGDMRLDMTGSNPGRALNEMGRTLASQVQEQTVTRVKGEVKRIIQTNKDKPVDTEGLVGEAYTAGSTVEANRLGEALAQAVSSLDEAFPVKARDAKLARFLTGQSGHKGENRDHKATRQLEILEQVLNGALSRRTHVAEVYLRDHAEAEAVGISEQARGVIDKESAAYIANLAGLPNNKAVIDWAISFLKSKNFDASLKNRNTSHGSEAHQQGQRRPAEKVQTFEQKLQSNVEAEIDKMLEKGWTTKNIKKAFYQRMNNGHATGGDMVKYANAYLARPQEPRDNNTTTAT